MAKQLWKIFKSGFQSNNGNVKWKIKEWQHQEGEIATCSNGFHASKKIIDAMQYTRVEIIAKVEVKGKSDNNSDKEAWSDMRIIYWYNWDKLDSVKLAVFCAKLCLKNYTKLYPNDDRPAKAIKAAENWIKNPCKKTEIAARSAAASASAASAYSTKSARSAAYSARSAADSAARSARSAYSAASASAYSAANSAYSAADSAARSARSAYYETINKIERYILNQLKTRERQHEITSNHTAQVIAGSHGITSG